jgi:L-fuculose-phosphate aldolase
MANEARYRRDIVHFGRLLHARGYVAATDGNLSVRLKGGRILATPTAMSKAALRPSDLVIADLEGRIIAGRHPVSSEIAMHLLIYRLRADIGAIVHAHPPTATGFAAAGLALDQPLACEVVIGLGSIPLAKYGTPGTPELSATLRPLVPQYDAILMSNHGVVTYADSLERAYMKMETVEHFAEITLVTHILGRQEPLEEKALEKLVLARSRYKGFSSTASLPLANHFGSGNGNSSKRQNQILSESSSTSESDKPSRPNRRARVD